jgi:transcriptional regulator with XRE-family HTH domain
MSTTFAQRLKDLRADKRLTQSELADAAEVHAAQISRYERGETKPTAEVVGKLARVLGTTADYLMSGASGEAVERAGLDREMIARFEKVQGLPAEDKQTVLTLLDAFIARQQIARILQPS